MRAGTGSSSHRCVPAARTVVALGLALSLGCASSEPEDAVDAVPPGPPTYYVQADAASQGTGSLEAPFRTLFSAQQASGPGDWIVLLPSTGPAINGGITLQAGQRLLGAAEDGTPSDEARVRVTNTDGEQGGVVVRLSSGNEIAGIRFLDLRSHAIDGSGVDLSDTHIHHNAFSGTAPAEEIFWAVRLDSEQGSAAGISIADNEIRDGEWLGGIQVITRNDARAVYTFERNTFSNLGGRAYHLWSQGTSYLEADIVDSSADDIGVGDKNSDSILPRLQQQSEQKITVRNYHYRNTNQVGSRSNCGMEAFFWGAPFPNPEAYCDGCKLTLHILDSTFEDTVTDGIQLTNFGSNSIFDVEIRGTRVLRPNPQQGGGGISLIAQNENNTGSRTTLLVENTEVIGSKRFGITILDRGEGHTTTVDLGGGALGSQGLNRFVDSEAAEIQVVNANPIARNNWWGRQRPRIDRVGDKSTVDWEPALFADPSSAP